MTIPINLESLTIFCVSSVKKSIGSESRFPSEPLINPIIAIQKGNTLYIKKSEAISFLMVKKRITMVIKYTTTIIGICLTAFLIHSFVFRIIRSNL